MKKQFLLLTGFLGLAAMTFGGGIVTNTNQSAAWVRTLVRDASTDADAVYFNPAGLIKLNDGFHFSLNSQTIFQNKDVTSSYQFLSPSPKKYEGKVKAPVFPGFYGTWKKNKIAVSFGFNPVGGGGGAEYAKGLPSFEESLSDLPFMLKNMLLPLDQAFLAGAGVNPEFSNITGYHADIYFKGTSVFFGYQLGLTYKINDIFSVYAGARYVSAKNTYKGHIRNVTIDANPAMFVDPDNYTPGNYLRAIVGVPGVPAQAVTTYGNLSYYLDDVTGDREVDVEEKGSGIAPILGANISVGDKLNIGLKYEFKTKIDVKQSINDEKDGGLFVQDSIVHSDMPAMASVGLSYKILPQLKAQLGFHYYFDRSANYGKTLDSVPTVAVPNKKIIKCNYYESALGLEYNITDKFIASAGYLFAHTGVSEDYQSDMSFSLTSSTFGFGIGYRFNENLMLNLGGAYTKYKEGKKDREHIIYGQIPVILNAKDTYYKDNLFFGIGVDVSF